MMTTQAEQIEGNRFRTLEDSDFPERAIPKFVSDGRVSELNPEWVNAEWEECFIWSKPVPRNKTVSPASSNCPKR